MDNFSISVKGSWKMVIYHLKHSYLNWRANPYKRKMIVVFHHFFQHIFLNLAFLIFVWTQSNFSSAWHDNQFFFCSFSFLFRELSTLGNVTCRRWPSSLKHLFSCEDCFEKVGFWFAVARIISVQRKIWLKNIPEKWAIFGQCARRHQSRWFQSVMILGLVFLVIEKAWQV